MHKKALITTLIFLLITGALAGCGDRGGKSEETVEELSGTFVGEAGSLSFSEGGKVHVSLENDALWILEGRENEQTYGYVFILGNEMISYDKAEAFYLHDGRETFARIVCRTEKDKIILRSEDKNEVVFERRTD